MDDREKNRFLAILLILPFLIEVSLGTSPVFAGQTHSLPTEAWTVRYDNGNSDGGGNLAIDRIGNLYVTGQSCRSDSVCTSSATVKYDASGRQRWVARMDDGRYAQRSAVDRRGNVYVGGGVYLDGINDGINRGFLVVKIDTEGTQLWEAIYDTGPYSNPSGLELDKIGNAYVSGTTYSEGAFAYTIIKYSPDGTLLWMSKYPGRSGGTVQLALDASGNAYIGGDTCRVPDPANLDSCLNVDLLVVKYDPNGRQIWETTYDNGFHDFLDSMTVDNAGIVSVTGASEGGRTDTFDFVTVQYDKNGTQRWVARYDSGLSDDAIASAVDLHGNVYVTGSANQSADGASSMTTIKYNPWGRLLWIAHYYPHEMFNSPVAIRTDSAGNVYVAAQQGEYPLVKYSPDGAQLWVASFVSSEFFGGPGDLAVSEDGDIYLTGWSARWPSDIVNQDITTVKYTQADQEDRSDDNREGHSRYPVHAGADDKMRRDMGYEALWP